jgi:hypothetical protein
MKNKDLIALAQTLNQVSDLKGKDFAYGVFKNKSLIEQEIKIFEQLRKAPHPDFQNYENERNIVCINYSKKDDNGNPIITNNAYQIEDMNGFNADMAELQIKYKEVLDDMTAARKEYEDFLEKESTIQLIKVKIENVPNDVTANLLSQLQFMIE